MASTSRGSIHGGLIRLLYGVRYTDMCAFRAIRRYMLLQLGMRELAYGWNLEMQMRAARTGLRIREVPVSVIAVAVAGDGKWPAIFAAPSRQRRASSPRLCEWRWKQTVDSLVDTATSVDRRALEIVRMHIPCLVGMSTNGRCCRKRIYGTGEEKRIVKIGRQREY